jgi:alkaline phosphatase
MRKLLFILPAVILLIITGCQVKQPEPKAKYVFLFIGDGMGKNQVYATQLYRAALKMRYGIDELSFTTFPVQSWATTYCADNLITDSAAAGTALASGNKTKSGTLNKDTTLTKKFTTIAEKAHTTGYKVGILTSVGIDHATPAAFYAHQDKRYMYYNISMEMPESGFDYFAGGGFHHPKGKNNDKPDAYENLKTKGYKFIKSKDEFNKLKNGDSKIFVENPQTYPSGEFFWNIDKKEGALSLAEMTKKAIEVLDNPKGFFMMVEGGKIDWSCHGNDAATTIHEVLAFDNAVAEAVKFYKQHPDETLIVVTADHETGGLTMSNKKYSYNLQLGLLQYQNISSQEFGRLMVNYKKEHPNATFEQVMQLVKKHFGLENANKGLALDNDEKQFLYEAYLNEFKKYEEENPDKDYLSASKETTIVERAVYLLDSKAGISWTSHDHSGIPVPVYAIGQGQDMFKGGVDNTDIPKIFEKLLNLK